MTHFADANLLITDVDVRTPSCFIDGARVADKVTYIPLNKIIDCGWRKESTSLKFMFFILLSLALISTMLCLLCLFFSVLPCPMQNDASAFLTVIIMIMSFATVILFILKKDLQKDFHVHFIQLTEKDDNKRRQIEICIDDDNPRKIPSVVRMIKFRSNINTPTYDPYESDADRRHRAYLDARYREKKVEIKIGRGDTPENRECLEKLRIEKMTFANAILSDGETYGG